MENEIIQVNPEDITEIKEARFDPEDPLAFIDDESNKCNEALHLYVEMNGYRSLPKFEKWLREEAAKGNDVPTTSIKTLWDWSKKHAWMARVRAYDDLLRRDREAIFQDSREKAHKARIAVAEAALVKANEALKNADISKAKYQDAYRAVESALEQLRKEYGDDQKSSVNIGDVMIITKEVGIDIDKL